jgi:hypothetical protein
MVCLRVKAEHCRKFGVQVKSGWRDSPGLDTAGQNDEPAAKGVVRENK